ncbi:MAG: pullulanase-type alpha-1,6-glucosidase [Anaerolineae bacterium]|nr:pullulanase-type alpha-1,6-glucosidase [Anaerolineae bacterium]
MPSHSRAHTLGRLLLMVMLAVQLLAGALPAGADHTPPPTVVNIPGSLQQELGCPGDWQPDCAATYLAYDAADDVWQGTYTVPAGSYEYKAALNDGWGENYGLNAVPGGPNIPLNLAADTSVKFYYDHKSHWITDNQGWTIATVPGNFQSELGCPGDWSPDCLRSWLQDTDGDGIYTFTTTAIPAGSYEGKAALDESWSVNYGAACQQGGANIPFTVASDGAEVYFQYNAATHCLDINTVGAPRGDLSTAKALWVSGDTIAWNASGGSANSYELFYAANGGMTLAPTGIEGGDAIALTYDPAGLSPEIQAKFPHVAGYDALKISPSDLPMVKGLLTGQIAMQARNADGNLADATSLQIQGVLDDLYTYGGALGVTFDGGAPTLAVWAPTAKNVTLHVYDDSTTTTDATFPMTLDTSTGVWGITGDAGWMGKFYLFEVEVYVRGTGQVEHNMVTDPYSFSLSMNSMRSQIVDLNDPALMPADWDSFEKPALSSFEDISIYELHVRDFSMNDATVPAEHRGKYLAFTDSASNGMTHLSSLAAAGLTHLHLLPVFDIASVNEDASQRQEPDWAQLASYPRDSDQQQAIIGPLRDLDGFNWGYDPYHYTTPEGSYASDPDGTARILEFRQMVQALNEAGLRVVMDVVYNHTNASGQNDRSVLDKIVPGYYHRLSVLGSVETSTCCQNTASEFNMMEKLMVDSLVTWATQYKVDGFRFDLMGHHMKSNMETVRDTLWALTPDQNGVDGASIYLYGEGWNFGEVANNARGVNATQINMAGTGIGSFNDRLRDGARGGGPFSPLQQQGFISGLYYDPNDADQGTTDPRAKLLHYMDWVRIGLAGNLGAFTFIDKDGNLVRGDQIDYNGSPAGYNADPQENIVYVSAHDNETLFDAIQAKAAISNSIESRVRMQMMGLSLTSLAQGVHFFHAGDDLLRSKSLDRNSYNSGDWFNRLDFSYRDNNWAVGLPPAGDNQSTWAIIGPLFRNQDLRAHGRDIVATADHFQEMMTIRNSSALFDLATADDVMSRVTFFNTGPDQTPGLIVMFIADRVGGANLDPYHDSVGVFFNASDEAQAYQMPTSSEYHLHEVQANSADPIVRTATFDRSTGTFYVPARTTAVFTAYDPPAIEASIEVTPTTALVGSTVDVQVRNRNIGGPGQGLLHLVPLNTNLVRYQDGSVYGGAIPVTLPMGEALRIYQTRGFQALLSQMPATGDVVAIAWLGNQDMGQEVRFGFKVTVQTAAAGQSVTFDDTVMYQNQVLATATASVTVPPLNAYEEILQDGLNGYDGTGDVFLDAWSPDTNYAGSKWMIIRQPNTRSVLVRFNLAHISPYALVGQAQIGYYVTYAAGNPVTVDAYQVYRPWVSHKATWNRVNRDDLWQTPGANGVDDRAQTATDSVTSSSAGHWIWFNVTDLAQGWVASPEANNGVLLKGVGTANAELIVAGSKSLNPTFRPQIRLIYQAP